MIILFTSPEATLETAGGKGANLVRLTRAGFNVPPGFILSTVAYRAFVTANGLDVVIAAALENLSDVELSQLETASAKIRTAFSAGKLPVETESALRSAYAALNGAAVAVRSSATAEDLPDLSFAGQQDTFLNVIDEAQLLQAVVDCWSSLWTARAIGYRMRNHISHDQAALAVVVQEMVQSEVSGVLFTANPLTGLLSESVIDATFGLGEALVSGQVEPDHFVVDTLCGAVNGVVLGAKKTSTRGKTGGGVESIVEQADARQTLLDEEICRLAAIGQQIQTEYGVPQDVEWAFAGGKFTILQSRAITSLFPVPYVSFDPLVVWFSFGAVQGLVGPITPLGRDSIRYIMTGLSTMFGLPFNPEAMKVFTSSGERIWIKISDFVRNPIGNRMFGGLLGFVEPSVGQILQSLTADPRLGAGRGKVKPGSLWRLARFALPMLVRMVMNILRPEKARIAFNQAIETYLATARVSPGADRFERLANVLAYMRERIAGAFPFLLPRFIPTLGPSMAALNLLTHLSGDASRALEVTRGLPDNVTTQMDLALWETARMIGADAVAGDLFRETDAPVLASRFMSGSLPPAAQSAVAYFMSQYGMRGVGEIDFGQPRWREDPTPVMHTLQSYLQISPEFAPDVLFARGEQAALAAIEKLASEMRRQPGGWFKEKLVRAAVKRVRLLMGTRESPKFFAIRTMGIARKALLEVG